MALAWRPEWPAVVVISLAWAALVLAPGAHAPGRPGGHAAHAGHAGPAVGPPPTAGALVLVMVGWTVMSIAMMAPATLPAIRHVGLNSIRRRRRWAMTVYLTAYVAVWAAFGVPILAAERAAAGLGLTRRALVVGTLLITAAWQLTRWKRRALGACRRTVPLPPEGRRADAACARFGVRQAARCIASCWPLMLVTAAVGHDRWAVAAVVAVAVMAEERTAVDRRFVVPIAVASVVAALGLTLPLVTG